MFGVIGRKIEMSQLFKSDGTSIPVTSVYIEPCRITQLKTIQKDGYNAIQISKFTYGLLRPGFSAGGSKNASYEFRVDSNDLKRYRLGETSDISLLRTGQKVSITGKSIGKGWAGNQKRHNFSRGPMTHGSKNHRLPGSIGAGSTPGRVYPGKKMAGRLGNRSVTLNNREITHIFYTRNVLLIKGPLPGKRDNALFITPSSSYFNELAKDKVAVTKFIFER